MATPWTDVLAAVPTLNDDQAPFSYGVDGETIVGTWDVAKIQMLGLAGGSTFSKDYRIEVRPAGEDTVDFTETGAESSSSASPGGLSFEKSGFTGKSTSTSFGTTAGVAGRSHDEPTAAASWSFDTDEIKNPLFDLLEQHGWKKKGLLGKIFG